MIPWDSLVVTYMSILCPPL